MGQDPLASSLNLRIILDPQLQPLGFWQSEPATWSPLLPGLIIPFDKNEPSSVTTSPAESSRLQRRAPTERAQVLLSSTGLMVLAGDVSSGSSHNNLMHLSPLLSSTREGLGHFTPPAFGHHFLWACKGHPSYEFIPSPGPLARVKNPVF